MALDPIVAAQLETESRSTFSQIASESRSAMSQIAAQAVAHNEQLSHSGGQVGVAQQNLYTALGARLLMGMTDPLANMQTQQKAAGFFPSTYGMVPPYVPTWAVPPTGPAPNATP